MSVAPLEKNVLSEQSIRMGILSEPSHPENYQVAVIRSLDEFLSLKAKWDGFLKATGIENLCLTHGWLTTWLNQFPADELLIVIVQDEQDNWLGVAPLKISRGSHGLGQKILRHLHFIGTQPNVYDWMSIPIRPDANEAKVLGEIAKVIQKSRWDVLDLRFMLDQAQCRLLCEALSPAEADTAIVSQMSMPYLELPDTVEAYQKARRKKTRLEVNRHCNRFVKDYDEAPALEFLPSGEAGNAALSLFVARHIGYWAGRGQKSDFQRFPRLQQFYRDMLAYSTFQTQDQGQAEQDEPKLLLSILKLGEHQLSTHLGFRQGGCYLSHLTNFNQDFRNYSPGTIHMDKLVFNTLEQGGSVFNFGRGDEPYKRMWATEKQALWDLRLFRNPLARLLWHMDTLLKKLIGKPVE